ncbi:MAG: hypothetical protein H6839_03905 [Planctomycetes bacterium]|nr:hypothetical protein [Planctomycetota bacterium]
MIGRVLAIAGAGIHEARRSRLLPLAVPALVFAVPLIAQMFSDDAAQRAWLSRSVLAEGLRTILPLAAIVGAGFLLKPGLKQGWTVLPARRAEYFIGAAVAGVAVLSFGALFFTMGGAIAANDDLRLTLPAAGISKQRTLNGQHQVAQGKPGTSAWANPRYGEELVLGLPDEIDGKLQGTIEYQMVWTGESPPRDRSPVAVWLQHGSVRTPLATGVQSRYRVLFEGDYVAGSSLVLQPTDPVLIVGTSPERVRFDVAQVAPYASILRLLLLSLCAASLCLAVVLFVRSLSTAPTAVLAGLLLLATLTLLPSLAPTSRMAHDRRAALEQNARESKFVERLEARADALPQLLPDTYFDEYLAGRVVPGDALLAGGQRLLAALLLLPLGAMLFRLRQMAK